MLLISQAEDFGVRTRSGNEFKGGREGRTCTRPCLLYMNIFLMTKLFIKIVNFANILN